jgi:hypothetical protein
VASYTALNRQQLIQLTGTSTKVYATQRLAGTFVDMLAGGWVILLNAACSGGVPKTYGGPISRKFETHGRHLAWHFDFLTRFITRQLRSTSPLPFMIGITSAIIIVAQCKQVA